MTSHLPTVGPTPTSPTPSVRVVLDPMPTVLTSMVEWFGPLRSRTPVAIRRQAAALVRGLDLTAVAPMMADPLGRGCPEFLPRLHDAVPAPTIRDSLLLLRAAAEDTVLHDIDETFGSARPSDPAGRFANRWHRDPHRALADLCQAIERYWYGVVAHVYPDIERRLHRATQQLREVIDEVGPQAAVVSLHPRLRFDLTAVSSVSFPGTGAHGVLPEPATHLVLKPMIATRLTLCHSIRTGSGAAAFALPTPGLTVAAPATTGDPLSLLIGPSRADLLRRLRVRPATTTGLAETSGLGPSTVSHHLGSLRDAGVVTSHRRGQCVLYALTERGHRLLGAA